LKKSVSDAYLEARTRRSPSAWAGREAAVAVVELPPGIKQKWIHFVDRRLEGRIQLVDNNFLIQEWGNEDETKYVSRGMPYSVGCVQFSPILITFGDASSAISVEIAWLEEENPNGPGLPVDPGSIAANQLRKLLCERVADYMGRIANP
jgi:hypothetical protein